MLLREIRHFNIKSHFDIERSEIRRNQNFSLNYSEKILCEISHSSKSSEGSKKILKVSYGFEDNKGDMVKNALNHKGK